MRRLILICSAAPGKQCEFATLFCGDRKPVQWPIFFCMRTALSSRHTRERALRYMHARLVARADSEEGQPQMEPGDP